MDTSEAYIKMCDCPEIQTAKTILERDSHSFTIYIPMPNSKNNFKRIVWLPRQDQIQEMIKPRSRLYFLLKDIQNFQVKHTTGAGIKTMEQLWLAFYMYEKHQKIWDGEKWIKKIE